MQTTVPPRIVAAERMEDGIFIEFDDGRSALYSASLLYSALPQAVPPDVPDIDGEAENGDE
jgi:hypothetical protein